MWCVRSAVDFGLGTVLLIAGGGFVGSVLRVLISGGVGCLWHACCERGWEFLSWIFHVFLGLW